MTIRQVHERLRRLEAATATPTTVTDEERQERLEELALMRFRCRGHELIQSCP